MQHCKVLLRMHWQKLLRMLSNWFQISSSYKISSMKNIVISVLLFLSIGLHSCKKSGSTATVISNKEAFIASVDNTKCGCCGGLFFEIDGKTYRSQTDLGTINPSWNLIDFILPLKVKISYKCSKDACGRTTIDIVKLDI
jgi:hypothetical protein